MPTPTRLHTNPSNVTFTPVGGGTATSLGRVTKVDIDRGVTNLKFKGDGDLINSFLGNVDQDPKVTVTSGNIAGILNSVAGLEGTLAWDLPDAKNKLISGGGGLHLILSNCMMAGGGASATHAQIASGTIDFESYAPDGITSPLAVSVL